MEWDLAENEADEAGRLEAALERIARAMPLDTPAPHPPQPYRAEEHISPDTKALAARLDALIAELRDILAQ